MGSGSDDVLEHYGDADERGRLDTPLGVVEFERTIGILAEHLPRPPAVVADIGGGPGRYALWLAERGYTVRHRDIVPKHVDQLGADAAACGLSIETAVGDARAIDLADGGADAVLLLGPLYHLQARDDRLRALREAARVVRPGGPVFAAAISRWAPRLHGEVVERLDLAFPSIGHQIETVEAVGPAPGALPGIVQRRTATVPGNCGPRSAPRDSTSSTWSASRGSPSHSPTWRRASLILAAGRWCWTPPVSSDASRSCSGSARTCWRRRAGRISGRDGNPS